MNQTILRREGEASFPFQESEKLDKDKKKKMTIKIMEIVTFICIILQKSSYILRNGLVSQINEKDENVMIV